jgi:hypothetical protein
MISKPTVFVLGAGASMPYGFPSGKGLRDVILSSQPTSFLGNKHRDEIFKGQYRAFQDALRLSAQSSVDAFLEHRLDLLEIGKVAIAYYLIKCELEAALFPTEPQRAKAHWYELLVSRMDAPFDAFEENQVRFITFNYDRSLEHFLLTALKHRHNKRAEEVVKKLQAIPIVHIHGQLAPLEWQEDHLNHGCREYAQDVTRRSVIAAKEGIKIISEATDTSDELSVGHEYVTNAQAIYFLGFGYLDTNMRRLLAPFRTSNGKYDYGGRWIGGTCFGLTSAQSEVIRDKYGRILLGDSQHDIAAYLNNTPNFLRD